MVAGRVVGCLIDEDTDLATELDAAFIVEDWDWIVGFDQAAPPGTTTSPCQRTGR